MPSELEKEYPARGPLRQYRFRSATTFHCFRCGNAKTAKLVALYAGDWNRRLCNGCYGRLLAVYEIKAGTAEDEVRADGLADLLLAALDRSLQEEARQRYLVAEHRAEQLSPTAARFLVTAEHVARSLTPEPGLDWSPAVIGLCKAVELEAVGRLVQPLTRFRGSGRLGPELGDRDLGRVARFCADGGASPPELGTLAHFLQTATHSEERRRNSALLGAFLDQMRGWPGAGWLLHPDGLHAGLVTLTAAFRNRAAHVDELTARDYERCRALCIGEDGLLWRLVRATTPRA